MKLGSIFWIGVDLDGNRRAASNINEWGQVTLFGIGEKPKHHVYSDRLYQWNPKKYNELRKKHFNDIAQLWDNSDIEKIEDFLSDYFEKKVKLLKVLRGENQSTGYPYWVFGYDEVEGQS